jgi:hypothetical protein
MSKTQSRRPANDTRPARRSLVEVTAAARSAVDEGLLAAPAAHAVADDPIRSRPPAKSSALPEQATAPTSPEAANAPSRGVELAASDTAADMVVKIAKDYQNGILDSIKLGLNAALDHAKDFAEARGGNEENKTSLEGTVPTVLGEAAAAFQAEVLELMKANVATSLQHARELAVAKTAAEVVELSATRAREQCELLLKQADALKSLVQSVTTSARE